MGKSFGCSLTLLWEVSPLRVLGQMLWERRRRRIRAPAGALLGDERLDAERVAARFTFFLRAHRRVLGPALLALRVRFAARRRFKVNRSLRRSHVGLLGRRVAMLQHVDIVPILLTLRSLTL